LANLPSFKVQPRRIMTHLARLENLCELHE
jgi:hypothetical protein